MLFSSMVFLWCFLPVVLIGYYLLDKRWRNLFLLLTSLIFYAWGEPRYIVLMLCSILINYGGGITVGNPSADSMRKKCCLALNILGNLALLGYFKYANFFVDSLNDVFPGVIADFGKIALPIGISFYTFQGMSYVIDVYRGDVKPQKNVLNIALYVSFFPQLVAGPIVKYHDVAEQIVSREHSVQKMAYGIRRFLFGLAKKVLIANTAAMTADEIFALDASSLSPSAAWLGILCYTLQIYYDFSGYSDMAIGLGKMFGFTFLENFNYPYISKSIQDFWRRWHISLSTWFKEYLYIPLGGNRMGSRRTYLNLLIVFAVTGIWHGAAWAFLVWGLYHGFFLLLERAGLKKLLERRFMTPFAHCYTILVFMVGWVFFRCDTLALGASYLKAMFVPNPEAVFGVPFFADPALAVALIAGGGILRSVANALPGTEKCALP